MSTFLHILLGLVIAAAGIALVLKTQAIINLLGPMDWAEAKLGSGGTKLLYKLFGVLVVFVGFMIATNLWDAFLQATLGSLFNFGG